MYMQSLSYFSFLTKKGMIYFNVFISQKKIKVQTMYTTKNTLHNKKYNDWNIKARIKEFKKKWNSFIYFSKTVNAFVRFHWVSFCQNVIMIFFFNIFSFFVTTKVLPYGWVNCLINSHLNIYVPNIPHREHDFLSFDTLIRVVFAILVPHTNHHAILPTQQPFSPNKRWWKKEEKCRKELILSFGLEVATNKKINPRVSDVGKNI